MDKGKIVSDIDACIVDMDGTLYFQGPVRRAMALRLGSFYLTHLFRIKELAALKLYREVREKEMFSGEDDFEGKQFEYVADKCGIDRERVEKTVSHWMHEVPLSLISKNRDEKPFPHHAYWMLVCLIPFAFQSCQFHLPNIS